MKIYITPLFFLISGLILSGCGKTSLTSTPSTVAQQPLIPRVLTETPSTPEQQALLKTFTTFFTNINYASDGQHLYINAYDGGSSIGVNYQRANDVDLKTFVLLDEKNGRLFKDKNGVYLNLNRSYTLDENIKQVINAATSSASYVSTYCLKDAVHVYCGDASRMKSKIVRLPVVQGVDAQTFTLLNEEETYFKDQQRVYCSEGDKVTTVHPLLGADPVTFNPIASSTGIFAKDQSKIYRHCTPLKNADPASFQLLRIAEYQKDKNHMYYQGWTIPGADPETFALFNLFLAKDKNFVYQNGQKVSKIADPASFIADDFSHGHDRLNHYEITRREGINGVIVSITPN